MSSEHIATFKAKTKVMHKITGVCKIASVVEREREREWVRIDE